MNTYPGIYKALDGTIYYYLNKSNFFSPDRNWWEEDYDNDDHKKDVNITREYLANTYGEVSSKEHAEFIVKLAEGHGFGADKYNRIDKWFCFSEDHLFFFSEALTASDAEEKLITIPLPPKEPETKEWPAVGDEVSLRYRFDSKEIHVTGKLKFISDKHLIVNNCHKHRSDYEIEKPPTPEEELSKSILKFLESGKTYDRLAEAIISGEIKGLSYKPE